MTIQAARKQARLTEAPRPDARSIKRFDSDVTPEQRKQLETNLRGKMDAALKGWGQDPAQFKSMGDATLAFQQHYNKRNTASPIKEDGIAGAQTWGALNQRRAEAGPLPVQDVLKGQATDTSSARPPAAADAYTAQRPDQAPVALNPPDVNATVRKGEQGEEDAVNNITRAMTNHVDPNNQQPAADRMDAAGKLAKTWADSPDVVDKVAKLGVGKLGFDPKAGSPEAVKVFMNKAADKLNEGAAGMRIAPTDAQLKSHLNDTLRTMVPRAQGQSDADYNKALNVNAANWDRAGIQSHLKNRDPIFQHPSVNDDKLQGLIRQLQKELQPPAATERPAGLPNLA